MQVPRKNNKHVFQKESFVLKIIFYTSYVLIQKERKWQKKGKSK